MIKLQRIQAQGNQDLVMSGNMTLALRPGESLLLNHSGVKTFKAGADLVLLVPTGEWDVNGNPIMLRLVVTGFFSQNANTQVVVTSADEPVQMITPESSVPGETAADAQAANANTDIQALLAEDSQSTLLHQQGVQTQSTSFQMDALLATNPAASLNWQTPLTQRPDAQISVKLPGVNLPLAPVIFPLSSGLTYPKGSNTLAVNKAMVLNGYSVQGIADANSSVTLVLKYANSADTANITAKVDASGQFSAQLPFKLLNAMPSGLYSITAYATDVLQAVSPPSNSPSLYIDVKPPEKVVFDWNESDINLNAGFINKSKAQDELTFKGKAEPGSLVKFSWMNKVGLTNPGDGVYTCITDDNGQWKWQLTPDMVSRLSISGYEKTQYLTLQVNAYDALDNESIAVVFNSVGLDLTPPAVPQLQIELSDSQQLDGQTYKTLSKKSLDQTSVFTGSNFTEPNGKIQVKLVNVSNPAYMALFDSIAVESDGTWSLKIQRNKISSLLEGVYQVSVRGMDEAGNESDWSSPHTIYLDVINPPIPTIDTSPAESFSIDIDGNSLKVVNSVALQNTQKKFSGTAEVGSTVILTVYDNKTPPKEIKKVVVTDVNGKWEIQLDSTDWSGLAEGIISYTATSTDKSGNQSDASEKQQLFLDATAPSTPTVGFSDAVMQRINPNQPGVRYLNRDDFQNGTLISGTGESGSSITLEINGTVVANQILVNSDGSWRYLLINSEQKNWNSLLADGTISVQVFATDLARNKSSLVNYSGITVEKHTQQPATPSDFQLIQGDDTGRSSDPTTLTDKKTNKVAPKLEWKIGPGLQTYIWYDSNGNGVLDAQEKTPSAVPTANIDSQNKVTFQVQILGQGQHTYFVTARDEWGNDSEPKSLTVTLDNSISNPIFDGFQGDNNLSLDEFNNRANITLSGTTLEDGCVVKIALFDSTGQNKLSDWVEVTAVNKNWSTANFFKNLALNQNGSFILRFINTDEAGNTTENTPLDVHMNIRSTSLPDVSVVRLSADTDSGNTRANTLSDNITRITAPQLTGQVAYDADADLIVRLYDSTGRQLVTDANSPVIAQDGQFSFAIQPEWLTQNEPVKFILKTYDTQTGTLSGQSKEVSVTLDQSYDSSKFTFDPVTDDNVINFDEFSNLNERPKLQGTSEVNSEITLVLSKTLGNQVITQTIQSSQITYTTGTDGKEYWSMDFTQSMGNILGDGRIDVHITAKDRAGNTYVHPAKYFDLKRGQLTAPQALQLLAADDTGVSDSDNITQGQPVANSSKRAITLLGNTNTTDTVEVTLFNDKNKNGVLDAGDDTLEKFTHTGNSAFQKTYQLDNGEFNLVNSIKNTSSGGQSSAPSDKLTVTIDTTIAKPSDIVMGNNGQISLVEYENSTFVIKGQGEANATVYLQFKLKSQPSNDLLVQPWTTQVNAEGVWRLNLSKTQMDALTEGELVAHVYQKDRAGNVSMTSQVDLLFDKTPPSAPTPSDIVTVLDSYYLSNNLSKPWERPGKGIIWTDLFEYNSTTLTQTPKFVLLAIALPTTGSLVKAGDTVKLTWGQQALDPVVVTAQDITNGFVRVQVMGDKINQQGKSDSLDVKALFTDQVGNKSAEFTVLSSIQVSLDLKSPSLDLSQSSQNNLGDLSGQDKTWYSNKLTAFKIKGMADPGATVKIYAKRMDGIGSEFVLTTLTADSLTGNYDTVLNLTNTLTPGIYYALQSESTLGNLVSVRSNAEFLNVNSLTVNLPQLGMQTLGGDGYVNSAERNAGVVISGNNAPAYAQIQIKLTNTSTGVDYYVNPFYALQNGSWSCVLGIIEWGVVGEGSIKVEVKQTNIYGDSSAYTTLAQAVKFDATVTEPLLNNVSGDNYINQLEYQASGTSVIQLSGKAEPGAKLSVSLIGANGGVYTPSTRPTVQSDSTWVLNIDKSILDTLGPGKVNVSLSHEDLAGNVSPTSKNTFFTIDLSSDDLSINAVTSDNVVNDVEKDQGVTLSGNAEAGSWIQITLKQNGVADRVLPGFKANGSSWVYALNKTTLSSYSDGLVTVQVKQTDVAGNIANLVGNFKLQSSEIQDSIVISSWGNTHTISLAEQLSSYAINGTGPANSDLQFQFVKADGSVINLPSVAINANGQWQILLTPPQMANLQGNNTLRYWATRTEQSTVIKQLNVLIDSNYPSPRMDEVGEDGSISLSDILNANGQLLKIQGVGEKYSTVTIGFKGSNNLTLPSKDAVVNNTDGTWSVTLTQAELESLTNGFGKVFLTLVQKDNNSNRTSVSITKSFEVDMLAPDLPSISEQADAKNFNTVPTGNFFSVAADGTVSDTDAKNGVNIAVPLAKVGGNFVIGTGDSISIRWGDQLFTKILTTADMPVGKNFLVVKVPLDVIAKAGAQTQLKVAVVYTDKSGNSSLPLTLIDNLVVNPPPPAPGIDTISSDGFINKDELNGLVISGKSSQSEGLVSLVFTTSQDSVNSIKTINDISVLSNGTWSTSLSTDLLSKWADGQYFVFATYTVNGKTSVSTKSVFDIDRVPPNAIPSANTDAANLANAVSELSGSLVRPWINGNGPSGNSADTDRYDAALVTESAKDVNVRVGLPSNAKIGDYVVLTWGGTPPAGVDNTVTQALSNADIGRGYMSVRVPSSLISQLGDFNGNNKLTMTAQFFDNAKNSGPSFDVIKGLVVDAVPLPVKDVSSNFGDWLNLKTAQSGWKFSGVCQENAEIEITMVGSSGYKTPPIRYWKTNGVIQTSQGQWTVSQGLNHALALQLGEGVVFVSIIQRDADGNPSAPYETSFRIDLTPPDHPSINNINKLTYSKYAEGKTITGQLEKNAVVTVYYELLDDSGSVVFTSDKKTATLNGDTWSDTLSKQMLDDFLTKLGLGKTGGNIRVNVYQTDLAGNDSAESEKIFGFESQPLSAPVFTSINGLDFSNAQTDAVLSQSDLPPNGVITVQGTTSVAGSQTRLVLQKINGLALTWDIQLPSNSNTWTKSLSRNEFTSLGDGQYKLLVSTLVLDANGNVENESLAKTLQFQNGQDFFTIDTNGPVCESIEINANGINGNAKAGDVVQVVLNFSELIKVDTSNGVPKIVLKGFGDGIEREALFINSNGMNTKQMVFQLTVENNTLSNSGNMAFKEVIWNNAVVTDLYGNPRTNTMPLQNEPHTVIVDTQAPTFLPLIQSISGTDSSSVGGEFITEKESLNVTVRISLSAFPIAETGAMLLVTWKNTDLLPYLIKTDDISNGWVDISLDKSMLAGLDETLDVKVKLQDIAGNFSAENSQSVKIDTIKPMALTVLPWMTDNLISAPEYSQLTDIQGSGFETGNTFKALFTYQKDGGTLSFDLPNVTVDAQGNWTISKNDIANFLTTFTYGPFELQVWQIDPRGNDSDKTVRSYFVDKEVPNPPKQIEIGGADDTWLNANEVSRLELKIYFDNQNSPKVNDKIDLQFWKYAYKQAQRPVNANADFSLTGLVITQTDIAVGYKLVTLTTSVLQQSSGQPVQEIDFEVKIIDQGNNVSTVKRSTVHLDTLVNTPVVDSDTTTVVGGVTPTSAQSNQHFKGGGVELLVDPDPNQTQVLPNSTNLTIVFRSQYGNKITKTHVAYNTTDGTFDQILTPNDFIYLVGNGRTEAVVYYEVFQTDKAGNVSGKAVDSFTVSLALSPPVLQSFTGDNIVNIAELAIAQKLVGVAVPSSTVTVKWFVNTSNGPVQIGQSKTVVSDAKGDWFVPISTAELAALTQGQANNFSAYFEATTSKANQVSQPSKMEFQVIRSVPSLSGNVVKFDANGDGANNDGLELSLTDAVLVRDLLADLKSKGMASGKWGKNFRIEAVDSVKVNGDYYAKTFRIFLGTDHSVTSASPIILSRTSLVNVANNLPPTDLSLIPPSFFTPISISMESTKSKDNFINANELQVLTQFNLYVVDDRPAFKPSSDNTYTFFLNGQKVPSLTDKPLTDFSNFSTSANWQTNSPYLTVSIGNSQTSQIQITRQGVQTLTAQIYNPSTKSFGYFSVPHNFTVDTEVDTEVKSIRVADTDGNGQVSPGDKILLSFAEAVNLSLQDLPTVTVNVNGNNVILKLFGDNATLKAIGGVYTPNLQDDTALTTSKGQIEALEIANRMLKSNVWEITIGTNPSWTPGDSFQLSSLQDNAGNESSSFTVQTKADVYNQPGTVLIDVVSKDNVISATDAMAPVNVSVKLTSAKVGDVVKLYMDGKSNTNLIGTVTLTAADVASKTVSLAVSADQWGGDGMRNLTATIQRGQGSVVTSDMRNVFVSTTSDHWSSTGKIIWFDTDNIVQETGSDVLSWQASVGGSVATSFISANMKASVLVRNAVNGHNQLFFNGPDYTYDIANKRWVIKSTDSNGIKIGSFMYFNDPQNLFANYTKDVPDVVANKISYTVIANGRKDSWQNGMLTGIGANGSNFNNGFINGGDFKLATGLVGLAYWGKDYIDAYQGQNVNGLAQYQSIMNNNNPQAYGWDMPYLKPGDLADMGYNPFQTNGMLRPDKSGNIGAQMLLSHVYDASPYGNGQMGDLSFFSNSQLIGHRVTDYKIVLGGGKPAGNLTYLTEDAQYKAIMATQFLIGAMNQTSMPPSTMADIEKNVTSLWRGMIGDIVWAAKAIKGAALQEINTYQAVKFGTVGFFVKPSTQGSTYDLSVSADKMNLLDDVLLLNQHATAGNGSETVKVAGADYVTLGNSSDTIILKDLNFRYLDGGKGEDTLKLDASFSTIAVIYLSDYVSNSRGDSSQADANSRVNTNGYHKLTGFETIDLASNSSAQTLSLNDVDVWQLSDTHSLKIKMDNQDLLLTQNLGTRLQGHFYQESTSSWYDGYYAPNVDAKSVTLFTQGGDRQTSLYSFDLSNNNKILDLNFDHSLKIDVGSSLQMGDFSVSGLGAYTFTFGGIGSTNPTNVSFNDLQRSLRFQSSDSVNGPLLIQYTGNQLQDTQGRPIPTYTWMIGSDLPNQDENNLKILNANILSISTQKAGVMMLGGGGEDLLTGGLGADTLIGGVDSDTLIGGDGSDTFVFAKDSGNIGGVTGDVIKDFNFGKNGGVQADTISLYQLFDNSLISQLGKGAANDANKLSSYLKLEWTTTDNNLQMVCSIDQTGNSNFSKLFTMTDLINSVGDGNFNQNQIDQTRLFGGESTSALLQKMLEEGRLVVQ